MKLRTAKPDVFATLYADPARLKGFLRAMTGISRGANMTIASKFPWANYKTAADCGTAQGDLIVQIALKNPHLAGIGFDLPEVAPIFEEYVEANGLSSRVRFHAGSFFTDPLPKVDVIMMGHILHDWNLEEKRMLIRKAYEALPSGGAFIVYDALIDDDRSKNAFGLLTSLNMLIETPGGFDYTRRRLHRLDERCRVPRDSRRAPRRTRLHGGRHQMIIQHLCAKESAASPYRNGRLSPVV